MATGFASSVWAAGLGRLTVQSALGQPLRAEVEVSSLTREEASSLGARLASAEAFRQAGLQFSPALAGLRFAIERRPDGRAFVAITSSQPINEPFVDLLVELNWATGRFVREYTFLLDPPELRTAGREVVEGGNVVQSAVVPPVASSARSAPVAQAAVAATATPAASAPAAAVPAASPAAAPARSAAPAPAAPQSARAAAGRSADAGPVQVRSGETLASIASRVKPAEVSLDQALIAIYEANRGAFFGGVHQLRAGASLNIPDVQTMAAVDRAKAREQLRVHTRDFAEYRARLADSARSVAASPAGQSAEGRIGARVEEGAAPSSQDQLKLSRSDAAAGAAAASAGTSASRAAEQNVARDAAVREAQSRVTELEKNVADLQKLVELKNLQLADLQKQVESARQAGQSASGAIAASGASQAGASAAAQAAPAAAAPAAAAPAPAAVAPSAESSQAAAPAPQAEADKPAGPAAESAEKPASEAAAPAAEAAAPAAKPAAAPAPQPVAQPGLIDELMDNPLTLPGLAAILALGAGYGWYSMRRRRKVEKFEDSLIAADGFATNSLFGSTGGQSVDTTSSSVFAASTRDSGVDVHATEVDPIAEAEVYIAYGREAQAEEILREALRKQPERQAIRAKLLEILSGRKDAKGFGALAAEMYEQTGGQNEEWPKVVTLGLALDPENTLYTGKAPAAPARSDDDVGGGTVVGAAAALSAAAGLDALVSDDEPAAQQPEEQAAAAEDDNSIDFSVLQNEVPRGFVETQPLAEDVRKPVQPEEPEVPALDFDLDLDTTIGKMADRPAAEPFADAGAGRTELEKAVSGRFDLPSLDLDLPGKISPEAPARREEETAVLGLDELDIDLPSLEGLTLTGARKAPASAVAEIPEIDLSAIGLDLQPVTSVPAGADGVRWQEMATKLDLASAYEEIGDLEGARELLDEVIKGGDSEQQEKARSMLARIV